MSRVMLIGYGPLPRPGLPVVTAETLRTRQLLRPALDAGHTVYLFTLPLPGTEGPEAQVPALAPDKYESLSFQRFTSHQADYAIRALGDLAAQLKPDALVGVGAWPSFIAARVPSTLPLWADLPGPWMAEQQGRAWAEQDDARLADAWAIERVILRRLDKFSAASRPQLHAMLGELGAVGRLNRHTYQYQFGHHVAPAAFRWPEADPAAGAGAGEAPAADAGPILRGPIVPADAFLILWHGAFHPWADLPTLVDAVNELMVRNPSVHFVATGGPTDNAGQRLQARFEDMVEQSPTKERYHRLGWLDSAQLPRLYREVDLALSVDARTYDTMFGNRARQAALAAQGVAQASTVATELSEWLEDGRALLPAPIGDARALVEAIEPWIDQREHLKALGRRGRQVMERDFSYERTTRALLDWLPSPALAPDHQAKLSAQPTRVRDLSAIAGNPLEEEAMHQERHRMRDLVHAAEQLQAIRSKRLRCLLLGVR